MRTPFEYGGSISGAHFVNRTRELDMLQRNFVASQNTVLISPRRWGKSSLVNRAIVLSKERQRNMAYVQLDMLSIRTEGQFLAAYLEACLKGLGGTLERSSRLLRDVASVLVPKVSFTAGADAAFKVGFDWRAATDDRQTILELPQKLAEKRGQRVVVAVDEFQGIAELADTDRYDAVLRSSWQHHSSVCYCLYGSKRHMMLNLFGSYSAPFYHFADTHVLEKIDRAHWVDYLTDRFRRFGKELSTELASRLAGYVDDHSHYVQQIAQIAFSLSEAVCTQEVVDTAYRQLLYQIEPFFSQQLAPLTRTQIGFLRALLDGHQNFSSQAVLREYGIGSSANASKLKRVLQAREFIQLDRAGNFEFVDPMFRAWLRARVA